jgi:hypothetical protein
MRTLVLRQPRTSIMMLRTFIHQRLQSGMSRSHGTLSAQFGSRTAPRFGMVNSSMPENLSCLRSRMGLPR